MKYTFACKRVPLNDSIKEYAQKKISKLERYFRQGISYAHGSYAPFFTRPISLILLIISVLCVFWPYISDHLKAKKAAKNPAPTAANVDVNDD
mgnify:CR=1 FL=1